MKKRILAITVCLAMVFTTFGSTGLIGGTVVNAATETETVATVDENGGVQIGDKIWIESNSYVYKNIGDADGHKLLGNYEVEIVGIEGEWYEFKFTNLGVGESVLQIGGYKYVKIENTSVEEPESEDNVSDSTIEVITEDGLKVSVEGEGLPKGLTLQVEDESKNLHKKAVVDDINAGLLESIDSEEERVLEFYGTYNIKLYNDGQEWQPNGNNVKVVIDGIENSLAFADITVTHILDTQDAVERAIEKGTAKKYTAEGLNDTYPMEVQASGKDDTIYYVQFTNNEDEGICNVNVDSNNSISFELDSFSTVQISASGLHTTPYIPNIDSDDPADKLVTNKTVEYNNDGTYTINLEAYATGVTEAKATEAVIVLDHSGSMYSSVGPVGEGEEKEYWTYQEFIEKADKMAGQYEGYYFATRKEGSKYVGALIRYNENNDKWERSEQITVESGVYNKLKGGPVFSDEHLSNWYELGSDNNYDGTDGDKFYKTISGATNDALKAFATTVKELPNCKVAVAGFSSPPEKGEKETSDTSANNGWGRKYGGTGLYVNGEFKSYKFCADDDYGNAFLSMDSEDDFATFESTINSVLTDYSYTTTNAGFIIANKVFEKSRAKSDDVNRIVILFTDGEPTATYNSETNTTTTGTAGAKKFKNSAIEAAKAIKAQNVSIYAFGPSRGSDVSQAFLNYMSSNYPTAQSVDNTGKQEAYSYAGLVASSEDLATVFREIGQKIVDESTTLNSGTILKDIVSDDFSIACDGNDAEVSAWSVPYTILDDGSAGFDHDKATSLTDINVDGNTVNVKGFAYDDNVVYIDPDSHEPKGAKLVVRVKIKPSTTYTGLGEGVLTNSYGSGIYSNGNIVLDFSKPAVDLFTDVNVTKTVVGNNSMVTKGEFSFTGSYTKFNKYESVNLINASNVQGGNTLDAIGEDETINKTDIKNGDTFKIEQALIGSNIVLKEVENADYDVSVTVNGNSLTANGNGEFVIPVTGMDMNVQVTNTAKRADLTIEKQISGNMNPEQSFMFKITDNNEFDMIVVIPVEQFENGKGSVTIKDLMVGTYTISEITDWSWRYEVATEDSIVKTIDLTNGGNVVKFVNKLEFPYWLSGDSYCENLFTNVTNEATN